MLIGVPTEIKVREYRVGLTPANVRELTERGHRVIVEAGCGQGVGLTDALYESAGATVVASGREVYAQADMIVKVKEPQPEERKRLRADQVLFTYLHLAPDPAQARDLIESGAVCIAYETVTSESGGLPLLAPMSEVAGRMSIQAGAYFLEKAHGGLGVLLGGAAAPKLITAEIVRRMKPGSVIVDVAIDQGGCSETSRPTTHDEPTYVVDGVIHYCVTNMPGAVPRTSTFALNNATLPFVLALADKGYRRALLEDRHL